MYRLRNVKRALPLIAIALVTLLVAAFLADFAVKTSWLRAGRLEWPDGLGKLEDFPKRFPKAEPTPSAMRLIELGQPLGIEFTPKKDTQTLPILGPLSDYVKAEQEDGNAIDIESPGADVIAFLDEHERDIDALRDHLLAHGAEIGWAVDLDAGLDMPLPNLLGHMHTARLLTARALVRARNGDARAWTDLEAVSCLDQILHKRPDFISQLIGLAIARMVNSTAWKLPLPVPASFANAPAVDRKRLFLRGWQGDAWVMWKHAPDLSLPFGKAFNRAALANMAIHQRDMAEQLSRVTVCNFDGKDFFERRLAGIPRWNIAGKIALPNMGESWTRLRRSEAEREATANALRIRAGQPFDPRSRCSDGVWRYENGTLSFTGDLPLTLVISHP